MTALVDKSILIRTETDDGVRFRLLETLREYGRQQFEQEADYRELRRRHADWYRQLARDAFDAWFSEQQLDWLARIQRDMPNIREALEFSLSEDGSVALAIVAALQPFWLCRGMLREARHWTDRALARAPREPTRDQVRALFSSVLTMPLSGDLSGCAARAAEARALAEQTDDPVAHAGVAMADGIVAIMGGELHSAAIHLEEALQASDDPNMQVNAMLLLGWALEFAGDTRRSLAWQRRRSRWRHLAAKRSIDHMRCGSWGFAGCSTVSPTGLRSCCKKDSGSPSRFMISATPRVAWRGWLGLPRIGRSRESLLC